MNQSQIRQLILLRNKGASWEDLAKIFKGKTSNSLRKTFYRHINKPAVKILIIDIETKPNIGYIWGLFDQNISLNQIKEEWSILSWAAKWYGDAPEKVMYADQRNSKNFEDDKKILKQIWDLMDEADVILGQNSKSFDVKKLNAKFLQHGFPPPSSYRQLDTKIIAKRHFAFTSNKLEYMSGKFCKEYKKSSHSKFAGFELWKQCLLGNKQAWDEMKKYNIFDVLSTEELYNILKPWDSSINFDVYHAGLENICSCGSKSFKTLDKFHYSNTGKFQKLRCTKCGKEHIDKTNLLSPEKRKSLKK